MKVGDLVTLKDHCKDSGRLAVIVEAVVESWRLDCVKIMHPDTCERSIAKIANLEVICENR